MQNPLIRRTVAEECDCDVVACENTVGKRCACCDRDPPSDDPVGSEDAEP